MKITKQLEYDLMKSNFTFVDPGMELSDKEQHMLSNSLTLDFMYKRDKYYAGGTEDDDYGPHFDSTRFFEILRETTEAENELNEAKIREYEIGKSMYKYGEDYDGAYTLVLCTRDETGGLIPCIAGTSCKCEGTSSACGGYFGCSTIDLDGEERCVVYCGYHLECIKVDD